MSLLAPSALWFLLLLGPLLWLWRFQQTRRTILIPSLAPFRHLREQLPKAQLVRINWLLLVQVLLLLALIGVLARPRLHGLFAVRPRHTIAIILDNSASLQRQTGGASAFLQARGRALQALNHWQPHDRILVVSTTPATLVTSHWVTTAADARAAIYRVQPTDAAGDLAGAVQLAQSLAGESGLDRLVVATDLPPPDHALPSWLEWHQVGRPEPNVTLHDVAVSSRGSAGTPLITATVNNFAEVPQTVELLLAGGASKTIQQSLALQPQERKTVVIEPASVDPTHPLTVTIRAPRDALEADNTVILASQEAQTVAVRLVDLAPAVQRFLTRLVQSTPTLTEATATLAEDAPRLDVVAQLSSEPPTAPTLYLIAKSTRTRTQPLRIVDWDTTHPTTRFLTSVDQLPVSAIVPVTWPDWARPVVWGSDGKQSRPLVGVGEQHGFRAVVTALAWDEINVEEPRTVELLVLLLNVCHWLAPTNRYWYVSTGTPFSLPVVPAGEVTVRLPTGAAQTLHHAGGPWEFTETWWAGTYTVSAGALRLSFHAHLTDETEANLLQMAASLPESLVDRPPPVAATTPTQPRPLDRWLLWMGACLFVLEWFVYQRRISVRSAV